MPAADSVSLVPDSAAPIPLTLRVPSSAPTSMLENSVPASESRASRGSPAQCLATSRSCVPLNDLPRPCPDRIAPRARRSRNQKSRYTGYPQHRESYRASPAETPTRIMAVMLNAAYRRHRRERSPPASLRRERFLDMTAAVVSWPSALDLPPLRAVEQAVHDTVLARNCRSRSLRHARNAQRLCLFCQDGRSDPTRSPVGIGVAMLTYSP